LCAGVAVLECEESSLFFWAHFFSETNIEFSLWFHEQPKLSWNKWAIVCAATCRIVESEALLHWWNSNFIFDAECSATPEDLVQSVIHQIPYLIDRENWNTAPLRAGHDLACALVSYYMPPVRSVAMQRMAYWHKEMAAISAEQSFPVMPVFLTAANHYSHPENIRVIRDFGDLLPYSNEYKSLFDNLRSNSINTIGLSWSQNIRRQVMLDPDSFSVDAVLFSGNPFFYFELGELFKSHYDCGVILDFRDPFAFNPRIKFTDEQRKILQSLELQYLRNADAILAVNQSCLDLVSKRPDCDVKRVEIANGYDERILDTVESSKSRTSDRVQFIYAGTFYSDCSPLTFCKTLDLAQHAFVHFGKRQVDHEQLLTIDAFDWRGPAAYEDVVANIKESDIGLIFTGGQPFEHTTKIFDYIGADIEVLIVTEGEVKTGEIHNLTKHIDGIYWIENTAEEIERFLSTYEPNKQKRAERDMFAREAQTKQLINLLSSLETDGVKPARPTEVIEPGLKSVTDAAEWARLLRLEDKAQSDVR